jgi:hypothetical protein
LWKPAEKKAPAVMNTPSTSGTCAHFWLTTAKFKVHHYETFARNACKVQRYLSS